MRSLILSVLALIALVPGPASAELPENDMQTQKTLSPYFYVHSDDPNVDRLPLKGTEVDVRIAGVIADVHVVQHYRNDGKRPLEAEYVFPGSTRAAVYGLTMTIGKRKIVAEIREKETARAEYQQAKSEGRSAALLEQHRPNVFKMNVANILPGDDIKVELDYTELIVPTDSNYNFTFPTVVGPRYTTRTEAEVEPMSRWQQNPYLHEREDPTSRFGLHVALNSGIDIKEVGSPSHQVKVKYEGKERALVSMDATEAAANNRDFVLNYRLAGDAVESGALLYKGDEENYFVAMIEPPKRVTAEQVPPRDYIFVVDVSGSMAGFPLDTAKALLHDLVGNLRPSDTFNVILFAGTSAILSSNPLPANADNVNRAISFIDGQRGGGGTELLSAMKVALALPGGEDKSRSIVVVTDGYVDVEVETFELIRSHLGRANLFAFGIGSAVNRLLIEGMAHAGQGEPFIVTMPEEAESRAAAFREYVDSPVLTRITLTATGMETFDIEPPSVPDVLAMRPVVIFGKWRGRHAGQLVLKGQSGSGEYVKTIDLGRKRASNDNSALRYLWARSRIARLADYERVENDAGRVAEITQLGLKYNLLTAYTSFIAVDKVIRNAKPGETENVKQPLPLPAGVSDLAVGEVPTSPEPETMLLFSIATAMAAWARRRRSQRGK